MPMPENLKKEKGEQIFQRKTGILVKILVPLLIVGFPVLVITYSDFLAQALSPYIPEKIIQKFPLFIQDIEFQNQLILVLTFALALSLGTLISRHLSQSLLKISQGLNKILTGALDVKIKVESKDEIGEVTHLLNRVFESLAQSQHVLTAREEELEEKSSDLSEKIKILEVSQQEAEKARLATLNILEDVDEARRELEGEKQRIEKIILSLVDGLLVFQNSEIILMSPSAEEILGVKSKDVLHKSLHLLGRYPNIKILTRFLAAQKKKPVFRQELILEKPERTFQITLLALTKNQNLAILHDVRREKVIEQLKTEFVSLAAHQLRTPLSAIKWTLRMILDGDLGRVTRDQKDFLEKTYRSNERMIGLINDLLNVARIEEGRYLYNVILGSVEDIVRSSVDLYQEEAKKKKISLVFKKPKTEIPKIKIDLEKIHLVTQNLIDNAIRYTFPGGKVTVSLKSDKKEIEFQVQDSGVGIPEDQKERVFSKFFRAANVMRMETEGSGLGLFIAKNIIEAHGGKIWFESKENKGATFYFTLSLGKFE